MPGPCRVQLVERGGSGLARLFRPIFGSKVVEAGPPVGCANAVEAVARLKPQVVVLDLEGNPAEALAALETLMHQCPTPVLLVTGPRSKPDAIRALAAGALDMVERPATASPDFLKALTAQLVLLAKVGVVRHVKGRKPAPPRAPFPLIAIAASLGGPPALKQVLRDLPKSIAAAVVICQHITAGFSDDLARWLKSETGRDVSQANGVVPLSPNRIFVASSAGHLVAREDYTLGIDGSAPVGGFRPSCDVLLKSAAAAFRERAIGVVLTGMGRDGARGLKEIRARGGHTVAQDAATSTVFGMPGEAVALGAAELVLPLEKIGAQLGRWA